MAKSNEDEEINDLKRKKLRPCVTTFLLVIPFQNSLRRN